VKKSAVHEESVGDQRVQVRVEVEVFAEGVDGHDHARRAFGQTERCALELGQAAVGDAAEFLDEPAGTVCLRLHARDDRKWGVPNSGIPSKIV